ncbi:MAG: hypothetical protein HOW73_19090 [Polyangiaceae bacterium]|nr:hypothetical protein [Polyangiaceae bacterium]
MAGCSQEWFESLSSWHDGEVTDADAERVEAHVAGCSACRHAVDLLGGTRSVLAANASTDVPDRVRARALAALAPTPLKIARPASKRRWAAVGAAGVGLVAAAATLFATVSGTRAPEPLPLAVEEELVDHHLGGFARERPCDFESSDPKEVGSWIQSELGYSVDVEVPAGTRLLGARLCRIEGERTAALMLLVEDQPLTVFVPSENSNAAVTARAYAGDGLRCTDGPQGKTICVKGLGRPLFAVAETAPGMLASTLESVP